MNFSLLTTKGKEAVKHLQNFVDKNKDVNYFTPEEKIELILSHAIVDSRSMYNSYISGHMVQTPRLVFKPVMRGKEELVSFEFIQEHITKIMELIDPANYFGPPLKEEIGDIEKGDYTQLVCVPRVPEQPK